MAEKPDKEKTCLISGRFDRPHWGHYKMISDQGQRYGKILIVVLNYPDQEFAACYRAQILREGLRNAKGEYEVVVNQYHFAKISIDELLKFNFHVYVAGNLEVLKYLEHIRDTCPKTAAGGERHFEIRWVDRPYGYEAGTERFGQQVKDLIP